MVETVRRLGRSPVGDAEDGFTTVQFVAAAALSLVMLVLALNFVVFMYGRGVVHAAVDEAVRAGSRASASAAVCDRKAAEVLGSGALVREIDIDCDLDGDVVAATASGRLRAWLPLVPDMRIDVAGRAVKEKAPE